MRGQPLDPAKTYRVALVRLLLEGLDANEPLQRFAREHPDAVREIYRMVGDSRRHAPEAAAQLPPMGLTANRKALETAVEWAFEQHIIPRRMSVDELFDDVTGCLD